MYADESKTAYDAGVLYREFLGEIHTELTGEPLLTIGSDCPYEADWRTWLTSLLPRHLTNKATGELVPFGDHHADFWNWVWSLERGIKSTPLVCIWPRGGGKSTSSELAAVMVGALQKRNYVLYVCETAQQAEDHIQNVAAMLENTPGIRRYYPHVADRMLSKYGNAKGWNRTRIRCQSGFTVDAIALQAAARGVKLDDTRPDLIILDDVDSEADSPPITLKKIRTITTKFLPTMSRGGAVLAVQNLIHPDSIFARLAAGPPEQRLLMPCDCTSCIEAREAIAAEPADFLYGRRVSGPFPALHDFEYEWDGSHYVINGRPIWPGMDLAECQHLVDQFGLRAFMSESQQVVGQQEGGLFTDAEFRHVKSADVPPLVKREAWVDPAVTETDGSDSCGIQIDGVTSDGDLYRLWSWEQRSTPKKTLLLAITKGQEFGATDLGVETNQGGDLWRTTYTQLVKDLKAGPVTHDGVIYRLDPERPIPRFKEEKASASVKGKTEGASRMLAFYQRGKAFHVLGTHDVLERALKRFRNPPLDLVDAAFWSWWSLAGKQQNVIRVL